MNLPTLPFAARRGRRRTRGAALTATAAATATVALLLLLLPAAALANNEPPVSCSATPASAFVGDSIAFHAAAPAGTAGTVHWYVDYSGQNTLTDTGLTGASVDLSHVFATATGAFGDHVAIGYLDADGDPGAIPICNIDYVAAARPDLPPTATLTGPSSVLVGQAATFSAAGSADPEGAPLHYAFDFDGSAGYEVDGGTNPVVSHVFSQADSARSVSVEVSDPAGHTASAFMTVAITSGAPAGPGPNPGGGGPDVPDTTKPSAQLKISTVRTTVESLGTDFVFGIDPSEDLTYTGKVTLKYKGRTYTVARSARTESLGNSGGGFIEKTMPRGSKATYVRLNTIIPKGAQVPITLTLSLKDAAGNTATVAKTVKIRKRHRGSGRTG